MLGAGRGARRAAVPEAVPGRERGKAAGKEVAAGGRACSRLPWGAGGRCRRRCAGSSCSLTHPPLPYCVRRRPRGFMTAVSAARARRPRAPTPHWAAPAPCFGLAFGFFVGLGGELFLFPTLREGSLGEGGKRGERGGGSRWCRGRGGGRCGRCPLVPRVGTTRGGGASSPAALGGDAWEEGSPGTPSPRGRAPAAPPPGAELPPAGFTGVTPPPLHPLPRQGKPALLARFQAGMMERKRGQPGAGTRERGPDVPLASGSPPPNSGASSGEIKTFSALFRRVPLSPKRREAPRDVPSVCRLQRWGQCGRGAPGFPRFGVKSGKRLPKCSRSGRDLHVALRSFPSFSGFFLVELGD